MAQITAQPGGQHVLYDLSKKIDDLLAAAYKKDGTHWLACNQVIALVQQDIPDSDVESISMHLCSSTNRVRVLDRMWWRPVHQAVMRINEILGKADFRNPLINTDLIATSMICAAEERVFTDHYLVSQQREALLDILTTTARLVVLRGSIQSGKATVIYTLLAIAAGTWRIALATTSSASRWETIAGAYGYECMTVSNLLSTPSPGLKADIVVVVDAETLDEHDLAFLTRSAAPSTLLVLVGDPETISGRYGQNLLGAINSKYVIQMDSDRREGNAWDIALFCRQILGGILERSSYPHVHYHVCGSPEQVAAQLISIELSYTNEINLLVPNKEIQGYLSAAMPKRKILSIDEIKGFRVKIVVVCIPDDFSAEITRQHIYTLARCATAQLHIMASLSTLTAVLRRKNSRSQNGFTNE